MTPEELPAAFARALASEDLSGAAAMLSKDLQIPRSAELLKEQYEEMVRYGVSPVNHIQLMIYERDWPHKESNDVAWAYVSMSGDGFSEAVAVVVTEEKGRSVIRSLEWGRP